MRDPLAKANVNPGHQGVYEASGLHGCKPMAELKFRTCEYTDRVGVTSLHGCKPMAELKLISTFNIRDIAVVSPWVQTHGRIEVACL